MKGGKDQWHMSFEAAEDIKGYHSSLNYCRKPVISSKATFTLANETREAGREKYRILF